MHSVSNSVSLSEATGAKISLQEQALSMMESNNPSDEAFDGSSEPIIYMSDNRMPVMIELSSAFIYIIFASLLLALLFILPGVRKTRLSSLLGLVTLLVVGASILLALEGSYWLTGSIHIFGAPYSALTSDTVSGKLEVNIGLSSANVTLVGKLANLESSLKRVSSESQFFDLTNKQTKGVDYNERFHWDQPEKMLGDHIEALRKGLPYPILTVTEFFSQDSDGFNWTRQLRQAGFYSTLALYTALASWCLMTIIMCVIPVYLPHMMQITGALMMSSVWIYTLLIQSPKSFAFQLGGSPIEFSFGYTYVTTFIAGAVSMFAGVLLFAMQINNPHKQVTIMDSEQYVKDQKVLYGSGNPMTVSTVLKPCIQNATSVKTASSSEQQLKGAEKKNQKVLARSDSVIIPIADIEENFKMAAKKTIC